MKSFPMLLYKNKNKKPHQKHVLWLPSPSCRTTYWCHCDVTTTVYIYFQLYLQSRLNCFKIHVSTKLVCQIPPQSALLDSATRIANVRAACCRNHTTQFPYTAGMRQRCRVVETANSWVLGFKFRPAHNLHPGCW